MTSVSSTLSTVPRAQIGDRRRAGPGHRHRGRSKSQNSVAGGGQDGDADRRGRGDATVLPAQFRGSNVTNATGQATFVVTDDTPRRSLWTAADSTDTIPVTATAQVTFTPETLDQTASTVTANPTTVPSDGSTP